MAIEVNVDAMVGPSHHFGGLGVGNVASQAHAAQVSYPRQAALQGLEKARLLSSLGVPQYLWLPPRRPRMHQGDIELLSNLGFGGTPSEQIKAAYDLAPEELSAAFSAAFMWAANSGTFTPMFDAADRRHHFTPANLISSLHRSQEACERTDDLRALFSVPRPGRHEDSSRCEDSILIHDPLAASLPLRDEGAANHMRLCDSSFTRGIHVFVHGADSIEQTESAFFPRHTLAASQAIARRHGLASDRTFFLAQSTRAISAGVFHNDVIATSHRNLVLYHELAFESAESELDRIADVFLKVTGESLVLAKIDETELPLPDVISSYLFNSQIVSGVVDGEPAHVMVCPDQCQHNARVRQVVDRLIDDPAIPIDEVRFVSLGQSMSGGGGPACLRLRLCIDDAERLNSALRLTPERYQTLSDIVQADYPAELTLSDIRDTACLEQIQRAYDNLITVARDPEEA